MHVLIYMPHEGPITLAEDDVEAPILHQILADPRLRAQRVEEKSKARALSTQLIELFRAMRALPK